MAIYPVTLFDRSYLAHVIVIWQIQTFIGYCTVFALFTVYLRAISKYKTTRAYIWRGDLTVGDFFALGLILGILRYKRP